MATNHGGTRKGAGRKPCSDKKQTVVLYIETSIVNNLGGIENAKKSLYNFAKIEARGEIIKTDCNAVQSINGEENAISHFVSGCCPHKWVKSTVDKGKRFCDNCGVYEQ